MKICAAKTCQNTSENHPLLIWHRLPKKYPLKRKWNKVLGINKSNQNSTFVCSDHFDTNDYYHNKSVLKPNIVPTLNICDGVAKKESSDESVNKSDDSVICLSGKEPDEEEEEVEQEREMEASVEKECETKISEDVKETTLVSPKALSPTTLSPSTSVKSPILGSKTQGVIQIRLQNSSKENLNKVKSPRTAAKIAAQNLMRVAYFQNNNHLSNSNSTEKQDTNTSIINFKNLMRSAKIVLIRTNKMSLSMVCADDPLPQEQQDALKNAQEEYDLVSDKISSFEAADAKIVYCETETDYEAYVSDNPISNCNSSNSDIVNGEATENSEAKEEDDDIQIIGFKGKEKQPAKPVKNLQSQNNSVTPLKLYTAEQFKIFHSNLVDHNISSFQRKWNHEMVFSESNIKGGEVKSSLNGSQDITPRLLLSIYPVPNSRVGAQTWDLKIKHLQAHLVKASRFLLEPLHWMIKMGMIRGQPLCRYCSMGFLELISNPQLVDRYIWTCKNIRCKKKSNVTRMSFYDKFSTIPLTHLLLMTYYWSIQHIEFESIDKRYLTDDKMQELWFAFRDVCKKAILAEKIGGMGHIIEISTVKMGRLRVFGAYDRLTGWVRLKAIVDVYMENHLLNNERIILPYLEEGSTLISTNPELGKDLDSFTHHLVSSEEGNPDVHIRNISQYLMKHLQSLFGKMKLDKLKLVIVQGLLNELQWREKYGKTPANSFWNILQHIAHQSGENVDFKSYLDVPISGSDQDVTVERVNSYHPQENHNSSNSFKRKQMPNSEYETAAKKMRLLLEKPLQDSATSNLDMKFYSRKRPNYSSIRQENKGDFKFKCPICDKFLKTNIAIMEHMKKHMESTKLWKPDLTDLITCKYCYREFDTPCLAQTHIERVHLLENPICCRICNSGFTSEGKLEKHLNSNHSPCEMPYSCQACSFRSSFITDIIDHFTFAHSNTSKLLCHYCLKIFEPKTNSIGLVHLQTFHYHIHKHQSKSVKKCNLCCLAFINIPELKAHKKQDHLGWKSKAGVFAIRSMQTNKPLPEFENAPPNSPTYPGYISDYKKYVPSPPEKKLHSGEFSICSECKEHYKENHFSEELLSCSSCTFTSHCNNSLEFHHQIFHSHIKNCYNNHQRNGRSFLGDPMVCICGFYSNRGNRLAKHLVLCEKKTCYPMTSLSKPSRRCLWTNNDNKDKHEASWINTSWMAPIRLNPLKKTKPPQIDESTEEGQKLALLRHLGLKCKAPDEEDSFVHDFTFPSPDHTYTSSQMVVPLKLSSYGSLSLNHFKQNESNNTFILCDDSENSLEESQVNNDSIGKESFVDDNINPHLKKKGSSDSSSSTTKSKTIKKSAAKNVKRPKAAESPSLKSIKNDFELIEISDDELAAEEKAGSLPSSLKDSCENILRCEEELEEESVNNKEDSPSSIHENGISDSVSSSEDLSSDIISKSSSLSDISLVGKSGSCTDSNISSSSSLPPASSSM